MSDGFSGVRPTPGARRGHPHGPQPLAAAPGAARRRHRRRRHAARAVPRRPSSLEALRFSPPPSSRSACIALLVFGALVVLSASSRPLRRRVTRHPGRAVSRGTRPVAAGRDPERRRNLDVVTPDESNGPSPQLVERLVEQAIERCRAIDDGLVVERQGLRRHVRHAGGVSPPSPMLLIVFGPAFLRHGLSALAHRLAQRRSREPVPHRRPAGRTRRFRAAPIRRSRRSSSGSRRPTRR